MIQVCPCPVTPDPGGRCILCFLPMVSLCICPQTHPRGAVSVSRSEPWKTEATQQLFAQTGQSMLPPAWLSLGFVARGCRVVLSARGHPDASTERAGALTLGRTLQTRSLLPATLGRLRHEGALERLEGWRATFHPGCFLQTLSRTSRGCFSWRSRSCPRQGAHRRVSAFHFGGLSGQGHRTSVWHPLFRVWVSAPRGVL